MKAAEGLGEKDREHTMELFSEACELLADEEKDFKAGPTYKVSYYLFIFTLQHSRKLTIVAIDCNFICAAQQRAQTGGRFASATSQGG